MPRQTAAEAGGKVEAKQFVLLILGRE